jgi:Type II CAAX prenyl endopeptidase Rce1-like
VSRRHPAGVTEMVTAERRTRWWAARPPSDGCSPISATRAYGEVLGVFGVFFAASVAAAGFAVAGSSLDGTIAGWPVAVPGSIDQIAVTALAVAVPVLLAGRRAVSRRDLGLAVRGVVTPGAGIRMAAWAVLALLVGSIVTSRLASGHLPLDHLTYPALTVNLFHGLQAGFLEETVVLAFVVTTLEQARRPLPEIVVVAVVLRASYHIYYGPGVLGVLVWAPTFVWLYRRFRSIVPLIIVHSAWDVLDILAIRWHGLGGLLALLVLGLLVTAPVTWLVDRSNTRSSAPGGRHVPASPDGPPYPSDWAPLGPGPGSGVDPGTGGPGPLPPPGWYPDPAGTVPWRWWTGTQWWWEPVVDEPAMAADEAPPGVGDR